MLLHVRNRSNPIFIMHPVYASIQSNEHELGIRFLPFPFFKNTIVSLRYIQKGSLLQRIMGLSIPHLDEEVDDVPLQRKVSCVACWVFLDCMCMISRMGQKAPLAWFAKKYWQLWVVFMCFWCKEGIKGILKCWQSRKRDFINISLFKVGFSYHWKITLLLSFPKNSFLKILIVR